MNSETFDELAHKAAMKVGDRRKSKIRFNADGWWWFKRVMLTEIEKAVMLALVRPKLQLIKESRLMVHNLECSDCTAKRGSRMAGQAFTDYVCKNCGRIDSYHNTATPNYCAYCAFMKFACRRCMQPLDKDLVNEQTS